VGACLRRRPRRRHGAGAARRRRAGAALGAAAAAAGLAIGHRFMMAPPACRSLPTIRSVRPPPGCPGRRKSRSIRTRCAVTSPRFGRPGGRSYRPASSSRRGRRARAVPANAVVLHFDDGYLDNWLHAAPILIEAQAPATFFASLDFVAPGKQPRDRAACDDGRGYMNWPELEALDAEPLFEVAPHGIDHGRVAVSDRIVGKVTQANWRSLAWLQWAQMPGPKHDWYLHETPPAVPVGAPVPESEGALAAAAFVGGRRETQSEYRARVRDHLGRCRDMFTRRLGRAPALFCWPENRVSAAAREVAAQLGYAASTGGEGRNTAAEPSHILSRIHAGDRALGFRWGPAEALRIRAAVGLFAGNHYWYLVAAPMDLTRRLVMGLRERFGSRFA
jgi:peptidoglycan/xylan/chitin deacetylase (PgdA/CDA1 family)